VNEMQCKEIVGAITGYLEGTLSAIDRYRFDAHLARCPHCTEYLAQMRKTIERLGRRDDTTLSAGSRKQLLDAFRNWAEMKS
jgi:anti-sigma factor RsiW